jgi:F0F1-type ATP synthase assembly protein I
MIAIILLGVFGGIQLDKLVKMEFPLFTVLLTVLSVILSIYYVIHDLIKMK